MRGAEPPIGLAGVRMDDIITWDGASHLAVVALSVSPFQVASPLCFVVHAPLLYEPFYLPFMVQSSTLSIHQSSTPYLAHH